MIYEMEQKYFQLCIAATLLSALELGFAFFTSSEIAANGFGFMAFLVSCVAFYFFGKCLR